MGQHSTEIDERQHGCTTEAPDQGAVVVHEPNGVTRVASGRKLRLNPKSRALKERYFLIYSDYVRLNLTEKQLADKYNYSARQHISSIIQWCAHQLSIRDKGTHLQTLNDQLEVDLREMRARLNKENANNKNPLPVKVDLAIRGEMRRTRKLQAQIQGILQEGVVVQTGPQQHLHAHMSEGMAMRRQGSNTIPIPEKAMH